MAYPKNKRQDVRAAYISGLSLRAAAAKYGVKEETAQSWKRAAKQQGDHWDIARAALLTSDKAVADRSVQIVEEISRLTLLVTSLVEKDSLMKPSEKVTALVSLADAYAKFSKGFGRINPAFSQLAVALQVLREVAEYLKAKDSNALAVFQQHLEPLGLLLSKKFTG